MGEKNTRVFGVTGPKSDSRCLNFKNVVCHDTLGDASLRRVSALDGVPSQAEAHISSKHLATAVTQSERAQGFRRTDNTSLRVDFGRLWNEYSSAGTKASKESLLQ